LSSFAVKCTRIGGEYPAAEFREMGYSGADYFIDFIPHAHDDM